MSGLQKKTEYQSMSSRTEQELIAIRKNLEGINASLREAAKSVNVVMNNPVSNDPSEVYAATQKRMRETLNEMRRQQLVTTVKEDIPVKITWMTPELKGLARIIKRTDGRVVIEIHVEGEDASLVEDLIFSQPVEALSLDSVER
jgi:hypothetical protein